MNRAFSTFARSLCVMLLASSSIAIAAEEAKAAKPGAARNKDIVDAGKKIYRGGIAGKSVPACAACHSPSGAGIPVQFARLAGQHQDYTVAQLTAFRSGARNNSPQMTAIAKR